MKLDMAGTINESAEVIKKDLILTGIECSQRGLLQCTKWLAELALSIDQVTAAEVLKDVKVPQIDIAEYDTFTVAKSFFDLKEYDRASDALQSSVSGECVFLEFYSRYLSGEKKNSDNSIDTPTSTDNCSIEHLLILRTELNQKYKSNQLDGYCLYLYAVVLKKLDLFKHAIDVFVESIHRVPTNWSAWLELSMLITDKDMLNSLVLPEHWMKHLFLAHTYLELQMNQEGLHLYQELQRNGFMNSTYVMSQIGVAYNNLREVDLAIETFSNLQRKDPYRLQDMDIYSNLLYIKEMKPELAHLAHHCCDINKYCVETCCVIGNYYSLRMQHEKAVLYFQRALKLNPNYLSAWTLMGHEYVEIKRTSEAIQAYRQAIDVNVRDYRAWYGLGQIYEILKMPNYCLHYFRKAQMLRPNDSRMVMALGEAYEKVDHLQNAKQCFWKAHSIGDIEGMALIKLANLFETLNESEQAALAYTEYVNEKERQGLFHLKEQSHAYQYLANFHIARSNLDDAYIAAQKCIEITETREEGKALLRQISRLRALENEGVTSLCNTESTADDSISHIQSDSKTPQLKLEPMNLTFTP